MDVLFTADASPWAPDAATLTRVHRMLSETHRCALFQCSASCCRAVSLQLGQMHV